MIKSPILCDRHENPAAPVDSLNSQLTGHPASNWALPAALPAPLTTRCSCTPLPRPSQVPQLSSPPVVSTSVVSTSCQILLHLESIPNPSRPGVVTSFSVSFKHRLYLHHIHTKVLPQLHLSFWGLLGSEVYPRHCPKSYFEIKYWAFPWLLGWITYFSLLLWWKPLSTSHSMKLWNFLFSLALRFWFLWSPDDNKKAGSRRNPHLYLHSLYPGATRQENSCAIEAPSSKLPRSQISTSGTETKPGWFVPLNKLLWP